MVVEEKVIFIEDYLVIELLALEIGIQVQEVFVVGHEELGGIGMLVHYYLGGVIDQVDLIGDLDRVLVDVPPVTMVSLTMHLVD